MKEINRLTVASTGRQMYYAEPFFSLSGYDLVKFNRTLSDQVSGQAEQTQLAPGTSLREASVDEELEAEEAEMSMEDGLRITLLVDDDETVYLALSSDSSGFWAGKDEYGNLGVGTKFLGRWLRQQYKILKNRSYRFGVAAQSVEKEGRRMWKVSTPKLYKGANK